MESAGPIQSICKGGEGPSLAAVYAWDVGVEGKTAGVLTQQRFLAVGSRERERPLASTANNIVQWTNTNLEE